MSPLTLIWQISKQKFAIFLTNWPENAHTKNFRPNFRVYRERAHPAFLTPLVVLVCFDLRLKNHTSPFFTHPEYHDHVYKQKN